MTFHTDQINFGKRLRMLIQKENFLIKAKKIGLKCSPGYTGQVAPNKTFIDCKLYNMVSFYENTV